MISCSFGQLIHHRALIVSSSHHYIYHKVVYVANRPRSGVSLVASEARQGVACKAGQTKRQEYSIDVLSFLKQPLQNKQCFHNLYTYLSAARNSLLCFDSAGARRAKEDIIIVKCC